jgi:hypothetical protein
MIICEIKKVLVTFNDCLLSKLLLTLKFTR